MSNTQWAILIIDGDADNFRSGRNRLELCESGAASRTRFLELQTEMGLVDVVKTELDDPDDWGILGFATVGMCVVEVVPVASR
jgi:hypothetical protein